MNSSSTSVRHVAAVLSVYAVALLLLCGCATFPNVNPLHWFGSTKTPTVQVLPAAPDTAAIKLNQKLQDAQDKAAAAEMALKTAQSEQFSLLGKLKSNVVAAATDNQSNPDGAPKIEVAGELNVATGRLESYPIDPAETAAAASRALLVQQGRTAEAEQAYGDAVTDAKTEARAASRASEQAAAADKARQDAVEVLTTTVAQYEARIAANSKTNTAHLQAVEDSIRSDQVRDLNVAGGLCVVLLGLGVGFGGLAGLRMTYPFGIMAAVLFGLAQVVGSLWFHYAIVIGLVIAVISAAYYLWQRCEETKTHVATAAQLATTTSVLHSVVPVLDSAYSGADDATKQVLDDKVFTPLATTMDRSEKALVETIRTTATTVNPAASAVVAVTTSKPTVAVRMVTPPAAAPTVSAPAV